MPKSLGGLLGFVVMAVVTVLVGNFVYNRLVAPALGKITSAAKAA